MHFRTYVNSFVHGGVSWSDLQIRNLFFGGLIFRATIGKYFRYRGSVIIGGAPMTTSKPFYSTGTTATDWRLSKTDRVLTTSVVRFFFAGHRRRNIGRLKKSASSSSVACGRAPAVFFSRSLETCKESSPKFKYNTINGNLACTRPLPPSATRTARGRPLPRASLTRNLVHYWPTDGFLLVFSGWLSLETRWKQSLYCSIYGWIACRRTLSLSEPRAAPFRVHLLHLFGIVSSTIMLYLFQCRRTTERTSPKSFYVTKLVD